MGLTTDLSRSPYFDDFDANNNFYRILYRPGVAVQTRELNQMQTILQDQVYKLGRHVFQEGSVIEGCAFTFDDNYTYVKINDNYANGTAFTIKDFVGNYVYNGNGLKALIVNANTGYQAQDPYLNTFYIKYLNSATYSNGSQQSIFANNDNLVITTTSNVAIGNVTVATVVNSTGQAYAFTTSPGVVFKDGFFINVQQQTLIIDAFDNMPNNVSVGFYAKENIITPEANSALYDNAIGSPNYKAPGAHRLQLVPELYTVSTSDTANTTTFFSVCDFKFGKPVSIKNDPQYAAIGASIAKRTYETNGNFVIYPFVLSTDAKGSSDLLAGTYLNLISSKGLGYVDGYRVEYVNNNGANLRKGTDFETKTGVVSTANFGYYALVNEYYGDFNLDSIAQVELHSTAKTAITNLGTAAYTSSTKIGTAYIRGTAYDSGAIGTSTGQYRFYLFNISLYPGFNFSNVKSIQYYTGGASATAAADVVQTLSTTLTSTGSLSQSNVSILQQPNSGKMIYPIGQSAIKLDGFGNISYTYRNRANSSFDITGTMTFTLGTVKGTGAESITPVGTVSASGTTKFIVTPSSTGYSTTKTGTIAVTSGQSNVTGTGTAFTTQYMIGDYIYLPTVSQTRRITNIANDNLMTVASNFSASASANTHQKAFLSGVPIDFSKTTSAIARSISTTATTATFTLGEATTGSFNATAYFDTVRAATVPSKKYLRKNVYVEIDCSSHPNGTAGPYYLGFPDIIQINNIFINSGSYANTGTNQSGHFIFKNNQKDSHYDLGYIYNASSPLASSSKILIDLDVFQIDASQGVGFFNANSYPVDDVYTSNTIAIQTQNIPQYITTDTVYDLRDSIDFRPYATNTATYNSNSTNWGTITPTVNPSSTLTLYVDPSYGSYLPSPDTNFQTDIQHYLPRKDIAIIRDNGDLNVVEGISSSNPAYPSDQPNSMTIGLINIPPYPSLSAKQAAQANRYDYAVTTTMTQIKRWTMKDINSLSHRIDNLEYFTSLSMLEQSTKSLLTRSSATGQNRFQNGIFVDPFRAHDIGDTKKNSYLISIDSDKSELRPYFKQRDIKLNYNSSASVNTVKAGKYIMLAYDANTNYISQGYATKARNCNDNIYTYKGTITFNPIGDTSPDLTKSPDVTTNLDLATNFMNITGAYGTSWGNWSTLSSNSTSTVGQAQLTNTSTDNQGNKINTYNTPTTTTTDSQQQYVGKQMSVTPTSHTYNTGTYVTNIGYLSYIKSTITNVTVHGMKPNTKVYAFVNSKDVNGSMALTDSTFSTINGVNNLYGTQLVTDNYGSLYAFFLIPPNTFTSTALDMTIVDVPDPIVYAATISTSAQGTFQGSNLTVAKGSSILNTQDVTISTKDISYTQNVHSVTTSNDISTVIVPPPPPAPAVDYYTNNNQGSCFVKGSKVTMVDGSNKNIEDIVIGDILKGYNENNLVIDFDHQMLDNRNRKPNLYGINNMGRLMTSEHPILTTLGWKSVDPSETERLEPHISNIIIGPLEIGDEIIMVDGSITVINSIEIYEDQPQQEVYNFVLNGDNTYIVNDIVVHNKGGDGCHGNPTPGCPCDHPG